MSTTPEQINLWRSVPSEHQRLEFKEAKTQFDFRTLCKYCVALANEGGGQLLFGIADKPPRPVVGSAAANDPIGTAEKLFQTLGFRVDVKAVNHPDGRVVVFHIPSRPRGTAYHLSGSYFMRAGEELQPMSEDLLRHATGLTSPPGPDSNLKAKPMNPARNPQRSANEWLANLNANRWSAGMTAHFQPSESSAADASNDGMSLYCRQPTIWNGLPPISQSKESMDSHSRPCKASFKWISAPTARSNHSPGQGPGYAVREHSKAQKGRPKFRRTSSVITHRICIAPSGLCFISIDYPGRCPGLVWGCPFEAQEGATA